MMFHPDNPSIGRHSRLRRDAAERGGPAHDTAGTAALPPAAEQQTLSEPRPTAAEPASRTRAIEPE
jgi:hypothetical protein